MTEPAERELADAAARVALSRVLTSFIDIVAIIVLVRVLVKEDVAALAFLLLVYEVAKHTATLGFPDSVLYFFERHAPGMRRAFVVQTVSLLCLSGLVAASALLALQAVLPWFLTDWSPEAREQVASLLPFFAIVVALEVPTWPTANVLIGAGRTRDAARWQLASSVLLLVALVLPLLAGAGVRGVALALVGYAVVRLLLSLAWGAMALGSAREPLPRGALREQLAFALPLGANLLATRLNRYLDKFIVAVLLTDAALADYQVGAQELPVVTVIPYAVGAVLLGRMVALARGDQRARLLHLWTTSIRKVSALVLPLAVFAVAMAQDIVLLLFGPEYRGAVPVFQLYGVILVQRVAQYGAMLQAHADTRSILRITLWMVLVNALLSVPLTLAFGIVGTAAATLVASGFGWWLYLRRIATLLGTRPRQVLPWRTWAGILGTASAVAALLVTARHTLATQWSPGAALAVTAVLHVVLTTALLRWSGLVSRQDLRTLRRWLSPTFPFR